MRIVAAFRLDEVVPALEEVQRETNEGRYAAGFVCYEAAHAFDPAMPALELPDLPLVWFGIFDKPSCSGHFKSNRGSSCLIASASITTNQYSKAVAEIRSSILAGDLYQANFTFMLDLSVEGDLLHLYEQLSRSSQCGYAAYLQADSHCILSFSPELFFKKQGDFITTQPMKGTMKRGRWSAEDEAKRQKLLDSEKDRAENLMIVDLLRNDLGRVAVPGTVIVRHLFAAERYPSLWQMTSTITAQAAPQTELLDLFRALFPCGSITGAPKIAAMHRLANLESKPRGVYCGAIGVVSPGGDCCFNVGIRTLTVNRQNGHGSIGIGGGITWDSSDTAEYDEALSKAAFLTNRVPTFDLFETMRLENATIRHFDLHVERLAASAVYFGWKLDSSELTELITDEVAMHPSGLWRVRVSVSAAGSMHINIQPHLDITSPQTYTMSRIAVRSDNALLYHKISARDTYDRAYSQRGPHFDVLLKNELGDITEFTRGSLVIEVDGDLLTPALSCGLLPGIERKRSIDSGLIREAVISENMLNSCSRLWFINSLRGWIEMKTSS